VRRVTTAGEINQTPTYHTNAGFTADGESLVFVTHRDGLFALCRADVRTGDITCLTDPLDVANYREIGLCVAPKTRQLVYCDSQNIYTVHLDTQKTQTLGLRAENGFGISTPSVDPTETLAVTSLHPILPLRDERLSDQEYWHHVARTVPPRLRFMEVPLSGEAPRLIYEEKGSQSGHVQYSPVDGDLLLIDRNFPPMFSAGSDGKTNRTWTLRVSRRELTNLRPREGGPFQVHSTWTFDGQGVVYHGWLGHSNSGGWYISLVRPDGELVREFLFPQACHYGHVTSSADRPAIVIDGNITPDLLCWVYCDSDKPRVEIIARHGTEWGSLPGQQAHPHPLSDPTGRFISFNCARNGRVDVMVVEI
jgi:hypothetical protein